MIAPAIGYDHAGWIAPAILAGGRLEPVVNLGHLASGPC